MSIYLCLWAYQRRLYGRKCRFYWRLIQEWERILSSLFGLRQFESRLGYLGGLGRDQSEMHLPGGEVSANVGDRTSR